MALMENLPGAIIRREKIAANFIIESFPKNYPDILVHTLAKNEALIRMNQNHFWGNTAERFAKKCTKSPINPWIFVGNNTEKLIKDLCFISKKIEYVNWYSMRFSSSVLINDDQRYYRNNESDDNFLINLNITIDNKVYPVSLIYFKPEEEYVQRGSIFPMDHKMSRFEWVKHFRKCRELFKSIDKSKFIEFGVDEFVKMCRELVKNRGKNV